MSEDRPTTWTQRGPCYVRYLDDKVCIRLDVVPLQRGAWSFRAGIQPGRTLYILRDEDYGPPCATREAAQAAAEQWVRDFAAGLIGAVATTAPDGSISVNVETDAGGLLQLTHFADWMETALLTARNKVYDMTAEQLIELGTACLAVASALRGAGDAGEGKEKETS